LTGQREEDEYVEEEGLTGHGEEEEEYVEEGGLTGQREEEEEEEGATEVAGFLTGRDMVAVTSRRASTRVESKKERERERERENRK